VTKTAAARLTGLDLLWRSLSSVLPRWRAASSQESGLPSADALSSARLRDLGLDRDQAGGNIDFAKVQHQRFF
jgi:hypothetical protein